MQLTAHKTVTQFMRYVHPEDNIVHAAAEHVAARRARLLRAFHRARGGGAEASAHRERAGGVLVETSYRRIDDRSAVPTRVRRQ